MTVRARPMASMPRPGDVALDDADVDACPAGRRPAPPGSRAAPSRRPPAAPAPRRPQHRPAAPRGTGPAAGRRPTATSRSTSQATSWPTSATTKRHAGDPDQREEAGQRGVDRRVGEPHPAEAAERDPGVGELDAHPAAGRGQRPGRCSRETRVRAVAEHAEEQRLEDDQQGRDPDPEDVQPADRSPRAGRGRRGSRGRRRGAAGCPRTSSVRAGTPTSSSGHSPYGCQARPSTAPAASAPERAAARAPAGAAAAHGTQGRGRAATSAAGAGVRGVDTEGVYPARRARRGPRDRPRASRRSAAAGRRGRAGAGPSSGSSSVGVHVPDGEVGRAARRRARRPVVAGRPRWPPRVAASKATATGSRSAGPARAARRPAPSPSRPAG